MPNKHRSSIIKNQDVAAATFVVGSDLEVADFTNLADAIANLPPEGGTIYMLEGTYTISVGIVLPHKPIMIIGAGDGSTGVSSQATAISFTEAAGTLFATGTGLSHAITLKNLRITGDGSTDQKLFRSTGVGAGFDEIMVDCCVIGAIRQIVRIEVGGQITDATFIYTLLSLPANASSSFWNNLATGQGVLVWDYVEAFIPLATTLAINAGVGFGPNWTVTHSYIGGVGQSTFDVQQARWTDFEMDEAIVTISGGDSQIGMCHFFDVDLTVNGARCTISDSIFAWGGGGPGDLTLGGIDHVVSGCIFDGANSVARAVDILAAAAGSVIDGCRFEEFSTDCIQVAAIRCVIAGCYFEGTNPRAVDVLLGGTQATVTGCVLSGFATDGIRLAASTCTVIGCRGTVAETGTAGSNRIEDAVLVLTPAASSTINNARKVGVTGGVTTAAFVSQFTHANSKGLLGIGTIKNTGGVNALEVREEVTDAFGVTTTVTTTVAAGGDYMLDPQTNFGTARPPYIIYAISVRHPVAATTFDLQYMSQGAVP